MHAKTRRSIYFKNGALSLQRFGYAPADNINPAHIKTDHLRCGFYPCCQLGVNFIGDVGRGPASGQVGVITQENSHTCGRYGLRR